MTIENNKQYQHTLIQVQKFKEAATEAREWLSLETDSNQRILKQAQLEGLESVVGEMLEEIVNYEASLLTNEELNIEDTE